MKAGDSVSKNFVAVKQIESLDELYQYLLKNPSIHARAGINASAFYPSWQIRMCADWISKGWFWSIKRKTEVILIDDQEIDYPFHIRKHIEEIGKQNNEVKEGINFDVIDVTNAGNDKH